MCCYVSSQGDDTPDVMPELEQDAAADSAVYAALCSLQLALIRQTGVGTLVSAGRTDHDLETRIAETECAVAEAFERFNRALCTQARGEPYRLLEASHGGVARSMRFRLKQNRTVAQIETRATRQAGYPALGTEAL